MRTRSTSILATLSFCAVFGAIGSAQQPADPLTELLREVQALRMELRTIAIKTLQAQSVATQLQIADQRIIALRKELSDVGSQRATLRQSRTMIRAQTAQLANSLPYAQREEFLKGQDDFYRTRERELADREKELTLQLTQEQGRSSEFDGELASLVR